MRMLLAAIMISAAMAAHAQSSGGGGSSGSGGTGGSASMGGGSSGSARTEQAPSGTMQRGSSSDSPVRPGGTDSLRGTAPGSSARGGGGGTATTDEQARVPDLCTGPVTDPSCAGAGEPTGTGLGDRGIGKGPRDRYGPEDSPVKGGPSFEGPTGRPLNLPNEGR